ncbi:valine--tRNA ligase [Candidatus Saccharibacteria bacterium]|nr:valine--tRNA ligase [Candidatus Saccharibacteria bacterium]
MKFASSYEPQLFEPDIYKAWEQSGYFNPQTSEDKNTYSIVMPPPNANGNLHIGHGLTIAIEDSLTRYNRLKGKSTWYIPGADHAGFETWVVFERALEAVGHTRFEYSRDELYAKVWDFVAEQRGNMELQVRALGASCAWNDLTFTLDENVVALVYQTFKKMWNDGLIYRGEKLVNYCPKHQTAFADIEVEHTEEPGHLWDIKYPLADDPDQFIVVSTTRPETLFGDQAVAVNPADGRYKDLIGKEVKLPLTHRTIPIIGDEHADPEYGTGAVKITPAHDFDDFEVGKRHNLENLRVIGDNGRMLTTAGESYSGLTTADCRTKVLNDLNEQGLLLGVKNISHAVSHCYKCGTVIEPTLKEQWFVDTEKLAKTAIEHLEKDEIKFYPASKKQVIINYLKGLKDWNISRQIPWGIPIPMFHKVEAPSSAATGASNYAEAPDWIYDVRVYLTEIEVGGVRYIRDEDTFDTWFSSSHWPIITTDWTSEHGSPFYPLNVMETGADILFAWVARMIMMGLYVTGEVPFKEVYLHGLVLDAHGKKMSKSKGNVINPMDLVGKYGSDAFRLGILRGRSAGLPQAFSEESVIAGRNLANKLWNISRLIQSWIDETEDVADDVTPSSTYDTDSMGEDWICREINALRTHLEKDFAKYRFAEGVEVLYSTIWDKYADWFLESQKLLKNVPLLKRTLEDLLIMAHPFMPFLTETIWQSLSWTNGLIINQKWPSELKFDPISAEQFERLMLVVSEARKVLAGLKDTVKGISVGLLYGDDALAADNAELIRFLTRTDYIKPTDGTPKGIRLAVAGREVYLDVPAEIVKTYKNQLTERILAVGRELDALNARMFNPNYVKKAPAHLVEETQKGIEEKKVLIERLKLELSVIE